MDCVPIRYQEHDERNRVAAKMAIVSCGVTKDGSPRPETLERRHRHAVTAPESYSPADYIPHESEGTSFRKKRRSTTAHLPKSRVFQKGVISIEPGQYQPRHSIQDSQTPHVHLRKGIKRVCPKLMVSEL